MAAQVGCHSGESCHVQCRACQGQLEACCEALGSVTSRLFEIHLLLPQRRQGLGGSALAPDKTAVMQGQASLWSCLPLLLLLPERGLTVVSMLSFPLMLLAADHGSGAAL